MSELWSIFIPSMILVALSEWNSRSIPGIYGEKRYICKDKFFYSIMAVMMAIFVGLRTWYNDTPTYIMAYNAIDLKESIFNIDWSLGENPGFNFVNAILRHAGVSSQGFLMIYALITVLIYLWFVRKYTDNIWLTIFYFFTMGNYTFTMAAIKQCVAVAFCLIAIDCAIQKKWGRFVFWVLFASTFHLYALMYLVAPFLMFSPWTGRTYTMLAGFGIAGMSLEAMLGTLVNITSMFGEEYDVATFSGEGVNMFRLIVIWAPIILSILTCKELQKSKDRASNVIMNLSMLNAEIMFIALFGTANYFARLANYFLIFQTISLPALFKYFTTSSKKFLVVFTMICYIAYFYYANAINQPFDDQFARITLFEYFKIIFN